ncbi:Hypothetical Protein FCC1311_072442 [Hondaea fermentalgiana]|uniref:S-adenosyl-L-methionine-dependent methyltransferase n=1 Tax=Hondaea fermentalgiana TaxID=2315210 RepID=A0A2R5GQX6_9STRA|nr:Hypothetical Protein FCC1311_072442 [Hondaea fermentalgiana]|eukprot:GBG31023.1 Hypothetical Protein FCC1311_072442 [Hondaea fermentalgiana]
MPAAAAAKVEEKNLALESSSRAASASGSSVTLKYDEAAARIKQVAPASIIIMLLTMPFYFLVLLPLTILAVLVVVVPWLLCKSGDDRIRSQSSKTAEATALGRFHNYTCGLGPDLYAWAFLPLHLRLAVRGATIPWFFTRTIFDAGTGVAGVMLGRTAFLDASIRYAVKEGGVKNLVLCGAGFDTRALRMASDLEGIAVYEADSEATQAVKLAKLRRAGLVPPANTTFCPINFNDQDLMEVLREHGFDATQKTIVIWEGVAMYLSAETVGGFVSSISKNLVPGSFLAMDWFWNTLDKPRWKGHFHGHDLAIKLARNKGEPYLSGFEEPFVPATVQEYFEERGLDLVDHVMVKSDAAIERYLTLKNGDRIGRSNEVNNFMLLRVPDA